MTRVAQPLVERFWSKVDRNGPVHPTLGTRCWLWTGAVAGRGYGYIALGVAGKRRNGYGHRLAYELFVADIPAGMEIDHLCREKRCVNPAHLEPVTPAENNRRSNSRSALNARKTHCRAGHAFDEQNTYRHDAQRMCRQCRADTARRWRNRGKSNKGRAQTGEASGQTTAKQAGANGAAKHREDHSNREVGSRKAAPKADQNGRV